MAIFFTTRSPQPAASYDGRFLVQSDNREFATQQGTPSVEKIAAAAGLPIAARPRFVLAGLITFLACLVAGTLLLRSDHGVTYAAPAGLGAFALFYVVAQTAERLLEMILPLVASQPTVNKPELKGKRDVAVVVGVTEPNEPNATAAAQAQANVDQATADRAAIALGGTAGVGMLMCGYLHANFLSALGVTAPTQWVHQALALAITGLAVGGGSKQLHDLITNASKATEQKSTPAETSG